MSTLFRNVPRRPWGQGFVFVFVFFPRATTTRYNSTHCKKKSVKFTVENWQLWLLYHKKQHCKFYRLNLNLESVFLPLYYTNNNLKNTSDEEKVTCLIKVHDKYSSFSEVKTYTKHYHGNTQTLH